MQDSHASVLRLNCEILGESELEIASPTSIMLVRALTRSLVRPSLLHRPSASLLVRGLSSALPWEPARFGGANIVISEPVTDGFEPALVKALDELVEAGKRGVWMRVPIEHSAAVAVAARHGFSYHHAEQGEAMLLRWLPTDSPCPVPSFATHIVGCGGLVINARNEVLCVREKNSLRPSARGMWKLPGGLMDLGEEVSEATAREVLEETGVRASFECVLAMRTQHGAAFGRDDFYMVSAMTPLSEEIRVDESEISECRWLPIAEYLADTERIATERGIGDTMNSWVIRNVMRQLDAGAPPAQWGWKAFTLEAGAAQSSAKVTGWGNRPTYNILGPPCFEPSRPSPA